jgi:integrase
MSFISKPFASVFDRLCCYRRLHVDLAARVSPTTLKRYQKVVGPFVEFIIQTDRTDFETSEQLDDLFLEYRTEGDLSRTDQMTLLAALEFFLPRFKKQLVIAREALRGRKTIATINHTVPMPRTLSCLFGARISQSHGARMASAVPIQVETGMRPSEMLNILPEHVLLGSRSADNIVIRLGVFVSTKAKREQCVIVDINTQPLTHQLLTWLKVHTVARSRIFPFSYWQFQTAIKQTEADLGLVLGLSAHSGRAGYATERIARGDPVAEVQRGGRWLSASNFLIYIDIIGSLHVKAGVAAEGLLPAAEFCCTHFLHYITEESIRLDVRSSPHRLCRGGIQTQTAAWVALSSATRDPEPAAKEGLGSKGKGKSRTLGGSAEPSVASSGAALGHAGQQLGAGAAASTTRVLSDKGKGAAKGKGRGRATVVTTRQGSIW